MKKNWGGDWTEKKLNAFENYVKAYLKIMYSTRTKCNGWPREIIYFDGFAGCGSRTTCVNEENNLFTEHGISKEDENVYKGSAERVLSLQNKFDYHYFVDIDQNSLNELQKKLKEKNINLENSHFLLGDVNDKLIDFFKFWNSNKVALILLDPFGMQVQWNTIEVMKNKRIDLWILVPSGIIINRFLSKDGEILNPEKLESFFGSDVTEIRNYFYQKETQLTLFGKEEKIRKIDNSINKIAQMYVKKLKGIFKYVTENPLQLPNSRNVTIFHFIFASNNMAAYNIANYIIDKEL